MSASPASPTTELPHVHEDVTPLLEHLLAIPSGDPRVVSAYVRLTPPDRDHHAAEIALKDEIRALEADHRFGGLEHSAREQVRRDLARVVQFVEHSAATWPAAGLAVFAWEAGGLFESVPLPRVRRTRVVLDRDPRTRELVATEPETKPLLAVLVDRARARAFEVRWNAVLELPGVIAPHTRGGKFHSQRGDAPGWGERDFHGRQEEERRHQHAEIVAAIGPWAHARPLQGLVLAGPKDHTAALAAALPEDLAGLLLAEVKLNPTAATPAEVQAATLAAAMAARERVAGKTILSLKEAVGRGLATEGIRETLHALACDQVRLLLVSDDCEGSGFRCAGTGRLVLSRKECHGDGEPEGVQDVVDEAIEAALRRRVAVMPVPRAAAAALPDGMGALLRFR